MSKKSKTHLIRKLSASLSRTAAKTNLFHRKLLWVWPVMGAALLAIVGFTVNSIVERSAKQTMADNLTAILNAEIAALEIWLSTQESNASALASDPELGELVRQLVEVDRSGADKLALLQTDSQRELQTLIKPWLQMLGYVDYGVVSKEGRILSALLDDAIGHSNVPFPEDAMDRVLNGTATVTRPFRGVFLIQRDGVEVPIGAPTMFALAPIWSKDKSLVALLALKIQPEVDFKRILEVARAGVSGETYAFDKNGLMLSKSRFDDQLKAVGLLLDDDESKSILTIQIRDPQVDMTRGGRPELRVSDRPLTKMAASATAGMAAMDVDGYSDYRGVQVIGAWSWLDKYNFGVATEVDAAEAYKSLKLLKSTFGALLGLLLIASVAIFVCTVVVAQKGQEARAAAMKARQLGQYSLDEKIGQGGMGVVYRGHHAMLRRPTAIKLLDVENTTDQAIARFEREVRLTSQLTHPNTIAIYDYGRTPDGVFYYAMEYLEGFDLEILVKRHGPQPEARVIRFLEQLAGSLSDAHRHGLIHRDIKPANMILTERGGIYDFVKLLDFGLVKAVDSTGQASLTAPNAVTGTPLYIAPEQVRQPDQVDARTDIYSLGAVAFFLLTGEPLFSGGSVIDICMKHVEETPDRPSNRVGKDLSEDFEAIVMQCLAKKQQDRPESANALLQALRDCTARNGWGQQQAKDWWARHAKSTRDSIQSPEVDRVASTKVVNVQTHNG